MASDQWLDLIQLNYNPQTMVSTCTVQDYGKYQYQKKKEQNEKRKTQAKWMKELKIGYTISDNDLQLKIDKAIELVSEWYSIRFSTKLKGREMIFKSKARERIQFVIERLWDQTRAQPIKEEPRWYSVLLSPKSR
jgi:translation initiation factor IF-3